MTYAGRGDVEKRASVLAVVEERVRDDLAVSLVGTAAATREAEGVACGSWVRSGQSQYLVSPNGTEQDSQEAPQTSEMVPLVLWRLETMPFAETCGASLQREATNLTLLSLPMRPSYATVSLAHLEGPAEPTRPAFAEAKRAAATGIKAANCMMICVGQGRNGRCK